MFFFLILLFVVIPVIELNVLIEVGHALGTLPTISLVFLTAIVGVSLVRSQGLSTLVSAQQKMTQGEAPGQEIAEAMMLAMAGVLLLIPGFVTDFIGLLLLTPITRAPIAAFVFKRMKLKMQNSSQFSAGFGPQAGPFGQQNPFEQRGSTFDGDFERKHDRTPDSHHLGAEDTNTEQASADKAHQQDNDIIEGEVTDKDDNQANSQDPNSRH
ncbi:FxsA family protein [Shewanella intestini]|uniref:FxsA family protein n=1 Tax=Shewanella intestini TaxID=2017544 RepID=A0ABS5I8F9_9GAMM|nr:MULTISPECIES: FxsA family protein [Shewanella]MBR9729575.1 FxsA family protein [Shewanella intestini]MRG37645.1 FxsA family protein [Shewanella sp. XMDDZSB0408]